MNTDQCNQADGAIGAQIAKKWGWRVKCEVKYKGNPTGEWAYWCGNRTEWVNDPGSPKIIYFQNPEYLAAEMQNLHEICVADWYHSEGKSFYDLIQEKTPHEVWMERNVVALEKISDSLMCLVHPPIIATAGLADCGPITAGKAEFVHDNLPPRPRWHDKEEKRLDAMTREFADRIAPTRRRIFGNQTKPTPPAPPPCNRHVADGCEKFADCPADYHDSDCAKHDAPAYPGKSCDCQQQAILFEDALDLLRSCYAVVSRAGHKTDWQNLDRSLTKFFEKLKSWSGT